MQTEFTKPGSKTCCHPSYFMSHACFLQWSQKHNEIKWRRNLMINCTHVSEMLPKVPCVSICDAIAFTVISHFYSLKGFLVLVATSYFQVFLPWDRSPFTDVMDNNRASASQGFVELGSVYEPTASADFLSKHGKIVDVVNGMWFDGWLDDLQPGFPDHPLRCCIFSWSMSTP